MKFKVGDRPIVRKDIEKFCEGNDHHIKSESGKLVYINQTMRSLAGKRCKIVEVITDVGCYCLAETGVFVWPAAAFEDSHAEYLSPLI